MEEYNYKLYFDDATKGAIFELVKKYHLEIDWSIGFFELIKQKTPKIVIFKLAEKMVNKEGTFDDVINALKHDLKMKREDAEELAHDIKNTIVPLVDIVEEEPVEEKLEPSAFAKDLKERNDERKATMEEPKPTPGVKKADIQNVEKNAEQLEKARTVIQQPQSQPEPYYKEADPYKETIE